MLVTSGIGVFAPMLLAKMPFRTLNTLVSTGIKQFGTGVIIATAFVHVRSLSCREDELASNAYSSTHTPI